MLTCLHSDQLVGSVKPHYDLSASTPRLTKGQPKIVHDTFQRLTAHRGIPQGYLNALEQRLGETEVALLHALTVLKARSISLHGIQDALLEAKGISIASTKADAIEEWRNYPLQSLDEWHAFKNITTEPKITSHFADEYPSTESICPPSRHFGGFPCDGTLYHEDRESSLDAINGTVASVPTDANLEGSEALQKGFHTSHGVGQSSPSTLRQSFLENHRDIYF